MDVFNAITELATTLSPLLAVLLIYMFNRIVTNDRRITKLENKADKTGDILIKIQMDIEVIKTKLETIIKEHEMK